jgi:hypothetical protein
VTKAHHFLVFCCAVPFSHAIDGNGKMLLAGLSVVALLCSSSAAHILPRQASVHSPCRFSPLYTFDEISTNSTAFVNDVFYWDGQFHQDRVGYNTANGLTYDGCLLNQTTGLANFSGRHDFSAASKEVSSLQYLIQLED